jgi:hypothetical protein
MAALNMSVKHGQPWEVAKANFEKGITEAHAKHGHLIRHVDWSDDKTSATITGAGSEVRLWLDEESVHAKGHVPFFVKLLEGQIRKFIEGSVGAK